jgi:hypothetical protein
MKADLSLFDLFTDLTQVTQETMAKEIQDVLSHEVDQLMADCSLTTFWQAADRDAEPRIILAATSTPNCHWSGPVS